MRWNKTEVFRGVSILGVDLAAQFSKKIQCDELNASRFFIIISIIRSILLSRPNKVGIKCPSVRYMPVRPQKVSSILMKFGT